MNGFCSKMCLLFCVSLIFMQAFHILAVPLIDLMLFGGPMKTNPRFCGLKNNDFVFCVSYVVCHMLYIFD